MLTWDESRIVGYKADGTPKELKRGYCVEADELPVGGSLANGSKVTVMGSGDKYYDEENAKWWGDSGGGGGNPNRVQTVTGTLDDPWGDVDFDELSEELQSGNATAIIEADATALGFGTITQPVQKTAGINNLYSDGADIDASTPFVTANTLTWSNTTGDISKFDIYAGGTFTDALAYASLVPTTLTIIWHPLPDA